MKKRRTNPRTHETKSPQLAPAALEEVRGGKVKYDDDSRLHPYGEGSR